MSRVTKPVAIPSGVEVSQSGQELTVKGSKGQLHFNLNPSVEMVVEDGNVRFAPVSDKDKAGDAMTGTMKSIVTNMMTGVSAGFEKKLTLIGVGYRAQAQGNKVNLSLGFSHPVEHQLPEGVTAETPSQTEIVIKGIDKQVVVRLLRISALIVHPSHTKVKVFVMLMSMWFVKKLRRNSTDRG